jgi:hypothetical protein
MRGLALDGQGRKHLVGLTVEESVWYLDHLKRDRSNDRRSVEEMDRDSERFEELENRYQRARFGILGAENELRNDKPSLN